MGSSRTAHSIRQLFQARSRALLMVQLKQASPSAAASAAPIASIRAIAPATEVTGAPRAGRATDMAVNIRSPAPPTGLKRRLPWMEEAG